jgi:flagellar hook assembly protein FlgD
VEVKKKGMSIYNFGDKSVLRVKLQHTKNNAEHSKTISIGKKGEGREMTRWKATEESPNPLCVYVFVFGCLLVFHLH